MLTILFQVSTYLEKNIHLIIYNRRGEGFVWNPKVYISGGIQVTPNTPYIKLVQKNLTNTNIMVYPKIQKIRFWSALLYTMTKNGLSVLGKSCCLKNTYSYSYTYPPFWPMTLNVADIMETVYGRLIGKFF